MLDSITRPMKEKILLPFARTIGRFLSPNAITGVSFVLGLASAAAVLLSRPGLALILWILNRITDGLDGTVARLTGRQSDFGGYIDIIADFVVYAAVPLAFAVQLDSPELWFALALMLSLFYVNGASWMYLSALVEKRNAGKTDVSRLTSVHMPSGLVEGTETIIIYTLFFIIPERAQLLMYIMSACLVPGILMRIIWAKRTFKTVDAGGQERAEKAASESQCEIVTPVGIGVGEQAGGRNGSHE